MALPNPPYQSSLDGARKLLAHREGHTIQRYNNVTLECDSGYIVGGIRPTLKLNPGDDNTLVGAIARWIDALPAIGTTNSPQYIGIWTDSETGIIHVDVVEVVKERWEAEFKGVVREEKAIWDCRNKKEIRL